MEYSIIKSLKLIYNNLFLLHLNDCNTVYSIMAIYGLLHICNSLSSNPRAVFTLSRKHIAPDPPLHIPNIPKKTL